MGMAGCRTGGGAGGLITGLVAVMLARDLERCLEPAEGIVLASGGGVGSGVAG
jgi:hypothetical protein